MTCSKSSGASSQWYVYIVKCADNTLYTGITNNIDKRIEQHNSSDGGAKYTRARRPVKCIYKEVQANRSEATKREMAIKKLSRGDKLKLIRR